MIRGLPVLALVACAHAPVTPRTQDANVRARAVADAALHEVFVRYPQLATMLRVPGEKLDSLAPSSLADERAYAEREDALAKEAAAIDLAAVTDPNAKLGLEIARDQFERSRRLRVCHEELWRVSPAISGWQVSIGNIAQLQPVGTDELRAQALARFGKLAQYVDDQIAALREGVKRGYTAAQPSVVAVIAQVTALEQMPLEQSPFYSPAARDTDPAFRDRFGTIVRDQIMPAVHRYRAFLADEYLPHARATPGVSALPDGDACYRATLRYYTTLDLDPREVHELGVRRLAELEAEMKEITQRRFGTTDLGAVMQRIKTDPEFVYRDKDDITKQTEAALARARAALPTAFHLLPKADFILEPIPAYQEKAASPYYMTAALDGSRPAAYRVRYYDPTHQSRANGEAIAFHEVLPGHHLQNAIANERTELPGIARFVILSGYNEGWGLYSERLADELHLYSDDISRLGMLGLAAVRAVRLIVDTGIHTQGWDRQRAIDLMIQHTTFNADQAAAEIDRYIAWPGQATSYVIGEREITKLRDEAKRALGPRFDLREFHDRVLEHGTVPLTILRRYIEDWIRAPQK
jgi:uncharacterized protein (DUF885 family)